MNFAQVDTIVNAVNSVNPTTTVRPNLMAFQIIMNLEEGSAKPVTRVMLPYPGAPVVFNGARHFLPCASRAAMDILGYRYGYVTFSARGNNERELMREFVDRRRQKGVTLPSGERFRPIDAMVDGDDITMLFIAASAKITKANGQIKNVTSLEDLGIRVSDDPKSGKRRRRLFANYELMLEGIETRNYPVETGRVYEVLLEDGRTIRILNFNMPLLDSEEESFVDGSMVIGLRGFNGTVATVQGSFGQGKGIAYAVPGMTEYDIYIYGSKREVVTTDGRVFIGALSHVHKGELLTDLQTITNMGSYDEDLLVEMAMRVLNERAHMLMDGDELEVLNLFAPQARAADAAYTKAKGLQPKWAAMQALEYGIGSRFLPVLFRRLFRHGFENIIDLKNGKCRIPMEGGARFYVRWNPVCGEADGRPALYKDVLGHMTINNLPVICMPDAPEGEVVIGRNPNAHPGEFVVVWNEYVTDLMGYKGKGWAFLGRNAGKLMAKLNDGDMDDSVMAIWNPRFIAKWKTMDYPVAPKLVVPKPLGLNDARQDRIARMTGVRDTWNWNIFEVEMDDYTSFSQSLGGFIVKGWIEMLLSGEHRQTILEGLDNDNFLVPEEFNAPSRQALVDGLAKDMKHIVPADYEPTPENFLAVCRKFVAEKKDYRGNRAMSNSFIIIDWEVMKKGDKRQVNELFAEAAELVKTPVFPVCFRNRIPAKRREAGDYILVETKLCRALAKIEARYQEIQKEAAEMEQLIVRPLPQRLLDLYPIDQDSFETIGDLRGWWIKALASHKDEETGSMPDGAYEKVAMGYNETVKQADGTDKVVRCPGLIDFYAYQFSTAKDGSLTVTDKRWSPEMRRKIVIHWLNMQYEDGKTADGVPDFMLTDLLMAIKEAGLAGRTVFADLNEDGRKYAERLAKGEILTVTCSGGIVYHSRNNKALTDVPNPYLFDGGKAMTSAGVIVERFADPELLSDWKQNEVAASATGIYEEDAQEGALFE